MPDTPEPTTFHLLRHAQTAWNREKRIQGKGDSPLTDYGLARLRSWSRAVAARPQPWHRIAASPLTRARRSAAILNEKLGLPIDEDERLREMDWGAWEGLTIAEVRRGWPGRLEAEVERGWSFRPPGGESRLEVAARASAALLGLARLHGGERLLVVTHLGVIKALLYHLEDRAYLPGEGGEVVSEALHEISCRAATLSIVDYNIPIEPAR